VKVDWLWVNDALVEKMRTILSIEFEELFPLRKEIDGE